ncbi:hypothetical protein SARC_05463 [Sphaeroforma arctica JP610]|uniref:MYND-type domain-containing protein n=1 Tax=Sphaeroforma arctica JP610 TaxID=667725 RepID=A0A0L0G096_9EUKA|nr:hypothetical protein SARC_05463 [Sphaeroforma arctica JP610]KNC82256.1 hypothetical protein SARC_05463 [Sphaeroforma arctica JP610]|eukprot:XP_014156158.1 hypothetical protein SARC_05463 [Sphaeroforma arctica JP610]
MAENIGECILCEKESDISCVCKRYEYCSRECQVAHWREHGHKETCTGEAEDGANDDGLGDVEGQSSQYSFFFDGVLEQCEKDNQRQKNMRNKQRYGKYRANDPRIIRWAELLSEYADTGVNPLISYGLRARHFSRKHGHRRKARVESDEVYNSTEHVELAARQMKRKRQKVAVTRPADLLCIYTCDICHRDYKSQKSFKAHTISKHPKANVAALTDSANKTRTAVNTIPSVTTETSSDSPAAIATAAPLERNEKVPGIVDTTTAKVSPGPVVLREPMQNSFRR